MSDELKKKISTAINDGSASMRPRWQFTTEHVLGLALGVGLVVIIWYLGSLATYVIRSNELGYLPGFGSFGWQRLLLSLPWLLILGGGLLILATNLLTRSQTTFYRQPWGITLLGIVFIALAGIAILNQARFHDRIVRSGPPQYVRYYSPLPPAIKPITGTITGTAAGGYVLKNKAGSFTIQFSQAKHIPNNIVTGQHVVIIGKPAGQTINAQRIRLLRDR